MPRAQWKLVRGRPIVPVILTLQSDHQHVKRTLIADTGGGSVHVGFDMLLAEQDCRLAGEKLPDPVFLGGAYTGLFPLYKMRVAIPELAFRRWIRVVGVPTVPTGFGGIACFRFLNRFTYGNFGDATRFGLET